MYHLSLDKKVVRFLQLAKEMTKSILPTIFVLTKFLFRNKLFSNHQRERKRIPFKMFEFQVFSASLRTSMEFQFKIRDTNRQKINIFDKK